MSCTKQFIGFLLSVLLSITPIVTFAQQTDQAGTALREGRQLLKRGQADKALIQLRNALNLYTAAKNNSGIAAAHNELGDLYLRQGQYPIALEHYQKAFDGFFAGDPNKQAVTSGVASAAAPAALTTAASAAASQSGL
jgi:tetratricopeptide (TPR) repeat protein